MNSTRIFNRQTGAMAMAVALVLALFASAIASAAQVTERSIALSSSSVKATGVTYTVNFTPAAAATAFVVDFCSDTPVVGQPCAAPVGFTAVGVGTAPAGFTVTPGVSKIVAAGTLTAATPVSVALAGVTNPDAAGPLYARIVTYDTPTNAAAYTSTDLGTGNVDEGGVAMSITPTVAVTGSVLESMTFCVASVAITATCANASANPPVLKLGTTVGDITVLDPSTVNEGDIFTQISTNATTGAVVSLKSNAIGCGGLINSGAPTQCYIPATGAADLVQGTPGFGVKTSASTPTALAPSPIGVLQPFDTAGTPFYSSAKYAFNWITGDATGVTSTFGDQFLDTAGAPVNNQNVTLTFGAAVSANTPAGSYSTDLSLIATGKF